MTRIPKDRHGSDETTTARAHARAVLYLRVSTPSQVNTDYDPEGISIPAQRVACERKAAELGAEVAHEFVEPGRTATTIDRRPAFQEMLAWIKQDKNVKYLVVYHFNRVFRNSVDAGITKRELSKVGCRLVSASFDMGEGPEASMVETILSAVDQYQSEASGADISYKMGQKAKIGGTLGRTRLGYINVREPKPGGGEVRTVALDPERAQFIPLAYELYATGEHTLETLCDELANRGLRTRATSKRPAGPISDASLAKLLRDRYYLGVVTYKGQEFTGRHQPLVDLKLFNRVQAVLDARAAAMGSRQRVHQHYLRGVLWCGTCHLNSRTNRMVFTRANGNGGTYDYYMCAGKQRGECSTPSVPVELIEVKVGTFIDLHRFSPDFVQMVRTQASEVLDDNSSTSRLRHEQLVTQMRKLDRQEENLLDLVADGALATTKVRSRLIDIARQKGSVQEEMSKTVDDLSLGAELIGKALTFMEDPAALYRNVSDEHRRLVLAALFERLYLHQDEIVGAEMRKPFGDLHKWHTAVVGQSSIEDQVEGAVTTRRSRNDRSAGPGRACASGRNTRSPGVSLVHGLNKDFVVELGVCN